MKQVLQNLGSGVTELVETPVPRVKPGHLLIATRASVLSAGTERMLVDFGRSNLVAKARQQPEKVKQVLDKMKTDGLLATVDTVRAKLDSAIPLGYCNAGVVLEAGDGAGEFKAGDRVVSNGPHAEVVRVSRNLCAAIPAGLSDEEAAFTVLGAIALQGVRLLQPSLGESFAVIGLGLVGLLAAQILQANGCRVLGMDVDPARLAPARALGIKTVNAAAGEDPLDRSLAHCGHGLDGVIITAATQSSDPVRQAAAMCRKRGRIVLTGVTGLALSREDFYEKELTFQVSCSYGPGRYDPDYEDKGQDYPIGYVRWTEQRNFQAVLELMASGKVNVKPLITHRFPLAQADSAYALLAGKNEPYLGIVLHYDRGLCRLPERIIELPAAENGPERGAGKPGRAVVGLVGAGNFTGQVLLPALKRTAAGLQIIASDGAISAGRLGRKFGFKQATSDFHEAVHNPDVNTVFITTRHDTHAGFVIEALKAGKHVFVEKPLCLTRQELTQITAVYAGIRKQNRDMAPLLMAGFNRRFSPLTRKIKKMLDETAQPKCFVMTVNAGAISKEHWTRNPESGGGRIIGEACHFIDLLRHLAGHPVSAAQASSLQLAEEISDDTASITLSFADGSLGTIHYLANGHRAFPKERLEVFCAGRILVLDNFKKLTGYGWPGFRKSGLRKQDKGHEAEVAVFIEAVEKGRPSPIPFSELVEVTRVSFEIVDCLNSKLNRVKK